MASNKQLLILEDLGISKAEVAKMVLHYELPFEVVWNADAAMPDKVEVLVNVKKKLDKKELQQYPNLKAIGVAFTGYDSVAIEECNKRGIAVYNVPAYSTESVTELTVALILALLREIPKAHKTVTEGEWTLKPGLELAGRKVGIFGTGKIGLNTARVFKALGCELIGWSRTEKKEFIDLGGKYIGDKREFFSVADVVSVHVPLNKDTVGIIGKKELEAMKETAYLINTARGPIVDEAALIKVLQENKIAGAGIDVFTQEPVDPKNPLLKLDNVVLTPHIAYKTEEALQRRAETTMANIAAFLEGNVQNRVNKIE